MTYLPLSRVILRYLVGMAVMYGFIGHETGEFLAVDPDVALIFGGIIGAIVEAAYAYAKRNGGAT